MEIFADGQDVEYTFETAEGPLQAIAEVSVRETTLALHGVALYPTHPGHLQIGAAEVRRMAKYVADLAALQGFKMVEIEATRLSGANPGRSMLLRRRLR